jgi:osmotically inducible protein OsmC
MPRIEREANVDWSGSIAAGGGTITSGSGVIAELPYTFATRVASRAEGKTSPEELLASAHAACYAMSLANELSAAGTPPGRLDVHATVVMDEVPGKGHLIVASHVVARGTVPGADAEAFAAAAKAADDGCPFAALIRASAEVTVDARLD